MKIDKDYNGLKYDGVYLYLIDKIETNESLEVTIPLKVDESLKDVKQDDEIFLCQKLLDLVPDLKKEVNLSENLDLKALYRFLFTWEDS